jgi:hypothetical protein
LYTLHSEKANIERVNSVYQEFFNSEKMTTLKQEIEQWTAAGICTKQKENDKFQISHQSQPESKKATLLGAMQGKFSGKLTEEQAKKEKEAKLMAILSKKFQTNVEKKSIVTPMHFLSKKIEQMLVDNGISKQTAADCSQSFLKDDKNQ